MSNEERLERQLAALDAIYNSTVDEEEPEATAKFFALMDEKEARRSALSKEESFMSNEEKILSILAELQADVKSLKSDVASLKERKAADELSKLSPEERTTRIMASFDAFQKINAEDPDGAEKFFALMKADEERKAAAW